MSPSESCPRKVRYRTEAVALEFAAILGLQHSVRFDAYRCPCCRRYHLTTRR